VKREAVADRSDTRDVREGKGLVAERDGGEVVPAREVLRAHDGGSVACKRAKQLGCEVVEAKHVLDHLVRVDDVEARVVERPRLVEISGSHGEAAPAGELGTLVDELEPVDLLPPHLELSPNLVRPRTVVAADIEQQRVRIVGKRVEDPRTVRGLGVPPPALHHPWQPTPSSGHLHHRRRTCP
jgi:hypothetical protein